VQAFVQASCRRSCRFVGTFVGVLGGRLGSIADAIYRVGDELSNGGIGELRSAVLGVEVRRRRRYNCRLLVRVYSPYKTRP
jgi:hypothetical protein